MADISQMTLPDGSVVNLKDSAGREASLTGLLGKVSIAQGIQNKGKILQVSNGGNLELVDPESGSGDMIGPSSASNNNVVVFDGATGKLVKDSGFTIEKSVPSDAVFTDTTYENKSAASGGTDESLVTTGEKYIWNSKTSNVGTVTGVKMNSGSSIEPDANGIVDLGTVITSHQDITGKADLVDGKVPSTQLPSYVDDVLEYTSLESFPLTGEAGKIYIATDTNKTYRWSGSAYVEISESLALGETSDTAYRGDRGKAAYDAAVTNVDSTPTTNSTHLITSGGVKAALPTNSDIVNIVYPVGSIYMSVSSTSPATLFGGTWAALEGRFLIGANSTYTAGSTGGAASVSYTPAGSNTGGSVSSHTLTSDQIPSHNHSFTGSAVTSGGISVGHTHTTTTGNPSANHSHSGPSHTHTGPSHTHTGPAHEHTGPKHQHSWGKYKLGTAHEGTGSAFKVDMDLAGAGTYLTSEAGGGWTGTSGTGNTGSSGTGATGSAGTGSTGTVSAWHTHTGTSGQPSAGHTHSVTASGSIGNAGGGKGHSHGFTNPTFTGTAATIATMPPYLSVYMWKRTA